MKLRHIWSVWWISTCWLVNRLWPVIDAPALFAIHLFDLASVWNVVWELLTLSKQYMASRSSRLAPTFVLGDLVLLSSKVYIFTSMTSVLVHFTSLIKLAYHCTSLNVIVDATFTLVVIVICFLIRHPLIKTDSNLLQLLCYGGHLAFLPWSISLRIATICCIWRS